MIRGRTKGEFNCKRALLWTLLLLVMALLYLPGLTAASTGCTHCQFYCSHLSNTHDRCQCAHLHCSVTGRRRRDSGHFLPFNMVKSRFYHSTMKREPFQPHHLQSGKPKRGKDNLDLMRILRFSYPKYFR